MTTTTAPFRVRATRVARAILPAVVSIVAVIAAVWTFTALSITFPHSGLWQRIFSTLVTFAGGYTPPTPGADATPPTAIAIPATLAFLVTVAAAASIVIVMSRRARNAIRVWLARPRLAVIGSGATAARIIASAVQQGISTVAVTEDEGSLAAVAARESMPVLVVPNLETPTASPGVLRLVKRAQNVVVATESGPENLRLRQEFAPHRPDEVDDFRSLMAVVQDPRLAEAMRPAKLGATFAEEDVTCPSENIAEHVCHLIDAAATGSRIIRQVDATRVESLVDQIVVRIIDVPRTPYEEDTWARLAETVELWTRRLSWGRIFLNGNEQPDGTFNPIVPVLLLGRDEVLPEGRSFTITVYAGSPTGSVTAVLEDRAARPSHAADMTVLVADRATAIAASSSFSSIGETMLSGRDWLRSGAIMPDDQSSLTLIVDPAIVGLDASLIVDAITLQWARMFDQTYNFMFAGNWSIIAWEPGAPLADGVTGLEAEAERDARTEAARKELSAAETDAAVQAARRKARRAVSNRYSSSTAVRNMLVFLAEEGYELVRCDRELLSPPVAPLFPDDLVTRIATREHDDWRGARSWVDRSGPRPLRARLTDPAGHAEDVQVTADFSNSGVRDFALEELEASEEELRALADHRGVTLTDSQIESFSIAANYNRRIITETYPAIAAAFGYAIVQKGETPFPTTVSDDVADWWFFPRRPNIVTAELLNEPLTWTTRAGDEMCGEAGDWVVTDQWGDRRTVAAEKFDGLYAPARSGFPNLYRRIGGSYGRLTTPGEVVVSDEGTSTTTPGDWLVQGEQGERWAVSGIAFSRGYLSEGPRSGKTAGKDQR